LAAAKKKAQQQDDVEESQKDLDDELDIEDQSQQMSSKPAMLVLHSDRIFSFILL